MKQALVMTLALALLPASHASLQAQEYTEVRVRQGGVISGVVRWVGPPPAIEPFPINKDPKVCDLEGSGKRKSPRLIVGPEGGVANAVVYISDIPRGKRLPPRGVRNAFRWVMKGCEYRPHVLVVPVGAHLAMRNDDRLLHNIHMFGAATYNLPFPEKGTLLVKRLPRPGLVRLRCDAGHGWMSGLIHVVKHPYYAVTDRGGRFSLTEVPPGRYTLKAWHEGWKVSRVLMKDKRPAFYEFEDPIVLSQKVTVPSRGKVKVEFALSERR